jgi:hypothetical protein
VGSGGSFGGNPLRQEIGLGEAARIVSVTVSWPATGETQTVSGIEPGRHYVVKEGVADVRTAARPRFELGARRKAKAAASDRR